MLNKWLNGLKQTRNKTDMNYDHFEGDYITNDSF